MDFDGTLVANEDMSDWWVNPDPEKALKEDLVSLTGGPREFGGRDGKCILGGMISCVRSMMDPIRFLETQDHDDLYMWVNKNGDYVFDKNFEPDAPFPWECFWLSAPYDYSVNTDGNFFSTDSVYDLGAISFCLFAPDGTGVGNFSYAGETAGWKTYTTFVDNGSAFDGIYTDASSTGGEGETAGLWFVGHDSIKGIITNQVSVNEAPAAFTVAQNSPNPFNPTTTISFSIPEAGNVSIYIFNVAGQKVDTIVNDFMNVGSHSVTWDASRLSAGVYFYTVKSGDFSKTLKMTLLK